LRVLENQCCYGTLYNEANNDELYKKSAAQPTQCCNRNAVIRQVEFRQNNESITLL